MRTSDFLKRRAFCLPLLLPNDVSRSVQEPFSAVYANIVVVPQSRARALGLDLDPDQFIELERLVRLEK